MQFTQSMQGMGDVVVVASPAQSQSSPEISTLMTVSEGRFQLQHPHLSPNHIPYPRAQH